MKDEHFERLYADHAQDLVAFLTYRTGNRVVAEDLAADTFERALRARARFDPRRASEKTWLYAIALNASRDAGRRRGAESRALEHAAEGAGERAAGPSDVERVADRLTLMDSLNALSDDERAAIALRYGAGLTNREVAKVCGESLTTAEGRVYRALRKLRDLSVDAPAREE